ncbi:unnamed protein product [Microthlaspi erraticum]|uniref:Uncharacterized protein n=1 Tax=Microthlaspi erraticum TaxID=1685480 RepID=A0A6D2IKR8_9BRAS|nr:unnamed protein product [Microthlaspi erraticum]
MAGADQSQRWSLRAKTALVTGGTKGISGFLSKKKRSYNQKSEDCPDGSIENSAQTAQSGWPRTNVSRSAKSSVRLKSRPKFQNRRPITHHDPGNMSRGRPRHNAHATRARPCRASRETKPRGRATCLAYHGRCAVRAGKLRPASGREFHRPIFIRPTTAADHESVRPRPFRSY